MASSDSFNTGQFAAVAVVVVIVSCVAGYYLAGGLQHQSEKPAITQTAQPSSTSSQTASAPTSQSSTPSNTSGNDYTAPNSPKIEIREEKAPPVSTKPSVGTKVASNPSDSEASQENSGPADGSDDTGTVGTVPSPVTGNATTPATSAQSSDPDYEQTANGSDSESNQEGSPASTDAPHPRYRVQVGTFTQAMSARSLADALRNRGYSTTTVTDHDGDKTVYHVQTGAFRSRTTADHVTLELQRQGFPAFVTPISQ